MNWDVIVAVTEILGLLAVVISVAYLSMEIRSNTRATKAAAGFDAMHSWASTNEWVAELAPEQKANIVKSMSPGASWKDFTEEERFDLTIGHRAVFQKLEGQYYLHKYGFLDEGIWQKRGAWAASLIGLPYHAHWWQEEKLQNIYTDEFIDAVEAREVFDVLAAGTDPANS